MTLPSKYLAAAALSACGCVASSPPVQAPIVIDLPPASPTAAATIAHVPSPSARPEAPPPTVVGRWEGTGQQSDGASWAMQVEILSIGAGRCATVRYPSIPCASEWICTEPSDGSSLRAREQVTDNRRVCLDGDVAMTLTPGGDLEWHWTGQDANGAMTAEAVLRRAN